MQDRDQTKIPDRNTRFKQIEHLPGDYGKPFIGNTFEWLKDPYAYDIRRQAKYGNVTRTSLFFQPGVTLYGPDALELLLFDKDNMFSTLIGYFTVPEFFPRGLLFRDFDDHVYHRRIMQAAFVPAALQSYVPTLNQRVREYLDGYEDKNQTLYYPDIKEYLMAAACKVFLGIQAEEKAAYFTQEFIELIKGPIAVLRINLPGTQYARSLKARKNVCEFIASHVTEKRNDPGGDMFALLCHAKDEDGNQFTDEEIVDHMSFLMLAAHDTLSGQLSTMIYYLAKDISLQEQLRQECLSLGKAFDEDLLWDDLPKLELVEWTLKETLRILPPVRNIPRFTIKSFEFEGYKIPAQMGVGTNVEFVHRMESLYPDPLKFDPWRFSPERAEYKRHRCAYQPFGGGPHRCIGMNYAIMQIKIMMYQLLQRYEFSVDEGYDMPMVYAPLLVAPDGLPIQIRAIT